MERLKLLISITILVLVTACAETTAEKMSQVEEVTPEPTLAEQDSALKAQGYQTFLFEDDHGGESVLMQQYFIVFLKRGPNRDQDQAALDSLQQLHMDHLTRMYNEGYADISGPMGNDGDLRGITIYNTPTLEMADSLARLDPMVQAGRLEIEVVPWWAGKGLPLR